MGAHTMVISNVFDFLKSRRPLLGGLGLLVVLAAFTPAAADAASTNTQATTKTYRWVDDQGIVHYGDSVPPQYAQKEQSILNSRGVEIRHLDAQKTPQQLALDAQRQQEFYRQKQHDAFLITTYTSVKDIEALRDQRLEQLKGQRVAAEAYVENLHSRLTALQTRAMLFKPYNTQPAARRMPDDLAEDLVRTVKELRTQNNALAVKGQEENTVRAQFQADIERYRALHADHPEQ